MKREVRSRGAQTRSDVLTGAWSSVDSSFLWHRAQLLPRSSSTHPCDYWLVHASGACLASSACSTPARFDPRAGALRFTACARALLNGPWLRLAPPGLTPILVTRRGLEQAAARGLLGARGWTRPGAAHRWLTSRAGDLGEVVMLERAGLDAALEEWTLPHGGRVRPALLREREAAEQARARAARGSPQRALGPARPIPKLAGPRPRPALPGQKIIFELTAPR